MLNERPGPLVRQAPEWPGTVQARPGRGDGCRRDSVSDAAAALALVGGPGEDRFPCPAVSRRFTRVQVADSGGAPPYTSKSPPEAERTATEWEHAPAATGHQPPELTSPA